MLNQSVIQNLLYLGHPLCHKSGSSAGLLKTNDRGERVYVALSDNDGDTWYEFPISDDPINGAPYINSGAGVGADYIGIDINNNLVIPVWSDNSSSAYITYTSPFSIACDADLTANCNQNINFSETLKAGNSVTIAGDPTSCYYNVLTSGGDVTAYAGNYVKMQKGFHAESGSLFHAFVRHCNVFNDATSPQRNGKFPHKEYNNRDIIVNKIKVNENVFDVFPNPYKDNVTIKFENEIDKISITLYNSFGNPVFLLNNNILNKKHSINLDFEFLNLRSGMYFLKLQSGNKTEVKKLVKM